MGRHYGAHWTRLRRLIRQFDDSTRLQQTEFGRHVLVCHPFITISHWYTSRPTLLCTLASGGATRIASSRPCMCGCWVLGVGWAARRRA